MKDVIGTLFRLSLGQEILVRVKRKDIPLTLEQFKDMTLSQIEAALNEHGLLWMQKEPEQLDIRMYGAAVGDVWFDKSGGTRTLMYLRDARSKEWETASGDRVKESELHRLRFRHGVKTF